MSKLLDEELKNVAGGSGRSEVIVTVEVFFPEGLCGDVTVKPFLEGELLSSSITTVDAMVKMVKIPVRGKSGSKTLEVKLNNTIIMNYVVNFDNGTYTEI